MNNTLSARARQELSNYCYEYYICCVCAKLNYYEYPTVSWSEWTASTVNMQNHRACDMIDRIFTCPACEKLGFEENLSLFDLSKKYWPQDKNISPRALNLLHWFADNRKVTIQIHCKKNKQTCILKTLKKIAKRLHLSK